MALKEFREYSDKIDLTQRRLLSLDQFRAYAGDINETCAKRFLESHMSIVKKFDNKVLIDRVLFDQWCDSTETAKVEQNTFVLPKVRRSSLYEK